MREDTFPFPRRYNSLRLLGFDYSSHASLWLVTIKTARAAPLLGDLRLAKSVIAALIDEATLSRLRLLLYTLLPDHLHLLTGVRSGNLSVSIGAFKSFTTQASWKRCREIVQTGDVSLPNDQIEKSGPVEAKSLLRALFEWRIALRPECMELRDWPKVKPQLFLGKHLWQEGFHDHVIRNDADLRKTIEYVGLNPVKRGYVSQPQFYPFTGWPSSDGNDLSGGSSPQQDNGGSEGLTVS